MQSFLRTADALKIKGLADQGLDQGQQQGQNQDFKSEIQETETEPPEQQQQQQQNNEQLPTARLSLHEPLKVPIPPTSQYRRSDSNSGNNNNSGISSPEINPELQPPAAQKSRGPLLNLNSSNNCNNNTTTAVTTNVISNTPPSGGGGFYNPVEMAAAVPLLKKKPEPEIQQPEPEIPYPISSPSPASSSSGAAFLHPSSPKHISKSETGSLGTVCSRSIRTLIIL